MSSPKEALLFESAERHNVVLTHSDFAKDYDFDYQQETEELNDFLLEKNWDKYFVRQKNGITICDVVIINKVFEECYKMFHSRMDTVEIFFVITNFYDIEGGLFFHKLVRLHRTRLVKDLEERIGKMRAKQGKIPSEDRIQSAFSLIFNKKSYQI